MGQKQNTLKQMTTCVWKSMEESEKAVDCLLNEIREKRIPAFDLLHQFFDRIEIFQSGKDPDQKDNPIMTVRICYRSEIPGSKKA